MLLLSKSLEEPREQRSSRSSLTRSFAGEGSSRKALLVGATLKLIASACRCQ